jgi:hypothetical protein
MTFGTALLEVPLLVLCWGSELESYQWGLGQQLLWQQWQ